MFVIQILNDTVNGFMQDHITTLVMSISYNAENFCIANHRVLRLTVLYRCDTGLHTNISRSIHMYTDSEKLV